MAHCEISVVTAITEHRQLAPMGNGRAEWYMPEDLKRFRDITMGHAVVIAAVTFETIVDALGGPLPGRTNIVVGARDSLPAECLNADTLCEGLTIASQYESQEIFVMGNGEFYQQAYPYIIKLYLTRVHGDFETGERFPDYTPDFTLRSSEPGRSGEFDYDFQTLTRTKGATIEL